MVKRENPGWRISLENRCFIVAEQELSKGRAKDRQRMLVCL